MDETTLYIWLVASGLIIGHIGIVARVVLRRPLIEDVARWASYGWTGALLSAWSLRLAGTGHLPMFGMYESALSLALATTVVALIWEVRSRSRTVISPLAVLVSAALLSHGSGFDPTPYALTISERSWVVDAHAILAWVAFGILAISNYLALRILRGRAEDRGLDRSLVTALQAGFLVHTAMIASGSLYKFMLFGKAWSFDPVESMALVVWMAYGTLLHLRIFSGWGGRRLASWSLGVFVLLVVSYRCLVYFPAWSTYHIFDMDRRIHVGAEELGLKGGTE